MNKIENTGLSHNPCQGCEAYYTQDTHLGKCVLDANSDCAWIKIYNRTLQQTITEKSALEWYGENVHRFPVKDSNKITSEIKEYELMRNSFMLGVHYAEQRSRPTNTTEPKQDTE